MNKNTGASISNPREFILSGNVRFTLLSKKTNKHFHYKITQCKSKPDIFFCNILRAPEAKRGNWSYLGIFIEGRGLIPTAKSQVKVNSPSFLALGWFLARIESPEKFEKKIEANKCIPCKRCGREMWVPLSCEENIGPVCKKIWGL